MAATARMLGLAVLLGCLWLGGCGYRLAGTESLPGSISTLRLETGNLGEAQANALRSRLRRAGATLVDNTDEPAVELSVTLLTLPDRTLVSSASNGKTVQRIARGLTFSLRDATGGILVANKRLTQQTDIVLDDDNLLASSQEKANVAGDLQRALFDQLVRQLNRI